MGRDDLRRSYVRGHMRTLGFISGTVGATEAVKRDPDKVKLASVMASSIHGVEKGRAPQGTSGPSEVRPSFSVPVSMIQSNDSQKLPATTGGLSTPSLRPVKNGAGRTWPSTALGR